MLIGCLTSSGKNLKHSQDENKFNNIEKQIIYRNDGGMWQPCQQLWQSELKKLKYMLNIIMQHFAFQFTMKNFNKFSIFDSIQDC